MKRFLQALILLSLVKMGHSQYRCASYDYLQQELKDHPSLAKQLALAEASTLSNLKREWLSGVSGGPVTSIPIIRIPVVVHLLYQTPDQNISDAQINSQIEVLNKEFRFQHADTAAIPSQFRSLAADCYIEFALAAIRPDGRATTGIVRKQTNTYAFGRDDKIKFSSSGGDDAWDANRYLNIWVGNLSTGIFGYSSPLGGPGDKDGIVVDFTAYGISGTAAAPYDKGRTAVHEVGHWLGLRHIWGDQYCGNDGVDDTPPQSAATRGCPAGVIVSCNNAPTGNMYMNYMDLTSDACTGMFTIGQREKMRSAFAEGSPRHALLFSNGINGIPLPEPPAPPIDSSKISPLPVYPNPASKSVTLDFARFPQLVGQNLIIYNQLGQQVHRQLITTVITQVQVSSFRHGVYFIKAGDYKVIKLVKQ